MAPTGLDSQEKPGHAGGPVFILVAVLEALCPYRLFRRATPRILSLPMQGSYRLNSGPRLSFAILNF